MKLLIAVAAFVGFCSLSSVRAEDCSDIPDHDTLKDKLIEAVAEEDSGLDLEMWATVVNRDGEVCAVAFSGIYRGSQWPGSRIISAQKANTANAFSLDGLALSTANLYGTVLPFGSAVQKPGRYGGRVQRAAEQVWPRAGPDGGPPRWRCERLWGRHTRRRCGRRPWRQWRHVPAGVSGDDARPDNIVFNHRSPPTPNTFEHPTCINTGDETLIPAAK